MMDGKVIVMTGATSGIGQIAAERLADMGARLVMVARDHARGEAVLASLDARYGMRMSGSPMRIVTPS